MKKENWWQKKVRLIEIDNLLRNLMIEFANTPLEKRENSWMWLKKARNKLKEL